jgi:hypothetical protein
MNLNLADKLLALATDESTTEEERRTAAVELAKMLKKDDFLTAIRKVITEWEKLEVLLGRQGLSKMRINT